MAWDHFYRRLRSEAARRRDRCCRVGGGMKLGTLRSPKFLRLARMLGCGKAAAAGHLEALWHFTAEQAPAGDVGRWADEDIEEACFWEGDSGALLAALIECGWLDSCTTHRLIVHDWNDHASEMVKKRNKRAGLEFASPTPPPDGGRYLPNGAERRTTADHQTRPDPTRPDQTRTVGAARAPSGTAPPAAPASPPRASVRKGSSGKVPKPERFEGEHRDRILAWASKRYGARASRILDAGQRAWECWGPAKDFTRPMSSWEGAFKGLISKKLADGTIPTETESERYRRELEESPLRLVGGSVADG